MTEQTDGYNGWSNRETWSVMLWINNDEGLQEQAREELRQVANEPQWEHAEALEHWWFKLFTPQGYADEFGADWPKNLAEIAVEVGSLWRVNWRECAESIIADLAELDGN